jgi:hypothetical protein
VHGVTPSTRARDLRPWLVVALLPPLLALLVMPTRVALLLGAMWAVLLLTVGLAATSRREEPPSTHDPRGRLHG